MKLHLSSLQVSANDRHLPKENHKSSITSLTARSRSADGTKPFLPYPRCIIPLIRRHVKTLAERKENGCRVRDGSSRSDFLTCCGAICLGLLPRQLPCFLRWGGGGFISQQLCAGIANCVQSKDPLKRIANEIPENGERVACRGRFFF